MKIEFVAKSDDKQSCLGADDYAIGLYRDGLNDLIIVAEDSDGRHRFVGVFKGKGLRPHSFDTNSRFTLTKLSLGDKLILTQD